MNKATENMIKSRIEMLDSTEATTDAAFDVAISERGFLEDLLLCEKGSLTIETENIKAMSRTMNQALKESHARQEGFRLTAMLIDKIEDMDWDCDAEVYDELLKIFDALNDC